MSGRHPFTQGARADQAHLRLMSTTDLHMQILPYDYVRDVEVTGRSLALAATTARHAAAEAANALLFDTGDAFEGGVIDDQLAASPGSRSDDPSTPVEAVRPEHAHPMADALAAAGVVAATLGNHDFNHGLPALERWLAGCRMPVVLSNIVRRLGASPLEDTPFCPPVALLTRSLRLGDGSMAPITIGVLGVAPPQILAWDRDKLAGRLEARDCTEAAAVWAPELRRRGAQLVIALCHSGIGAADPAPMHEHAVVPIAALPDVDVVFAGHSHRRFPAPEFMPGPGVAEVTDRERGLIHGTPVVMPGFWGHDIGRVDLLLEHDAGAWRVADREAALRRVRARRPDAAVAAAGTAHHARALAEVRTPVGESHHHLHTYFGMVAESPVVRLEQAAQSVAAGEMLHGRPEADLPRLSASAPLKAGGLHGPTHYSDVPPGTVRRRHLADLYVYTNTIVAVVVTPAEIRQWLERSASVFHQVATGAQDAPLLDPDHASYNFDSLAGVTYRIDLNAPAAFDASGQALSGGGRIRDLRHNGQPVADDARFVLITNGYRLGAGNGFPGIPHSRRIGESRITSREALARAIAAGAAEQRLPPPSWAFCAQPGTTVVFPTGPGARGITPPGPAGVVSATERTRDGFDLWRLDLARAAELGPAADLHARTA